MKLVNKNTTNIKVFGEIVPCNEYSCIAVKTDQGVTWYYRSLAELNEEWEDYEEPENQYYIDCDGRIFEHHTTEYIKNKMKEIGNYFETKEEAEKAVEKLKAAKRLKDKGFRFLGYYHRLGETKSKGEMGFEMDDYEGTKQDLDLLFGGKE